MIIKQLDPILGFTPITLSITIESMDELKALYGRIAIDSSEVNLLVEEEFESPEELYSLWEVLSEIANEKGIS